MLPRSKGKKKISLENTFSFPDKESKPRAGDVTPMMRMAGLKRGKRSSQSRESNNQKSGKSRSKPSNRLEEFHGKVFRTQNAGEDAFGKKYPLGYYVPTTTCAGQCSHLNNESADLESHHHKPQRRKHKLSLSSTGPYLVDRAKTAKNKFTDKTPLNRLNMTCDLNTRLEGRSKSKSSKKSRAISRVDEEREIDQLIKMQSLKKRPATSSKSKPKKSPEQKQSPPRQYQAKCAEQLESIYKKVCQLLDIDKPYSDDILHEISKMFSQYVKLTDRMNSKRLKTMKEEDIEAHSLKTSSRLLSFFCTYAQTNIKSLIQTRSLTIKANTILEDFIESQKEALSSFVPKFFSSSGSINIVDAVKLVRDFSTSMIQENKVLTSYIKEHIDSSKIKDIAKKAFEEKSIKLVQPKVELDLQDLRNKLNESYHLKRETYNSSKTRPKGSEKAVPADELPTEKQRTTFDVASSSQRSRQSHRESYSRNRPISEMGNSEIMRLRNEEDYSHELEGNMRDEAGPIGGKRDKYSSGGQGFNGAEPHRPDTPSRDHDDDSSLDAYQYRQQPTSDAGSKPPDREDLRQKLKLNLKKNDQTIGFHEEFMNNFDQFSLSWRNKILQEKNAKHYLKH